MAKYRQDNSRRPSAIQTLLSMFHLSNNTTATLDADEELSSEVDEPPDEPLSPLRVHPSVASQHRQQAAYTRSALPPLDRKESLLTRALMTSPNADAPPPFSYPVPATLSRASTVSNASIPSPGLTSDADDTSPARSASPSPPLPATQYHQVHTLRESRLPPSRTSPAISKEQDKEQEKPEKVHVHHSTIEENLVRRRCITFDCASKPVAKGSPQVTDQIPEVVPTPKRKCVLTFACPSRPSQTGEQDLESSDVRRKSGGTAAEEGLTSIKEPGSEENKKDVTLANPLTSSGITQMSTVDSPALSKQISHKPSKSSPFHEFATTNERDDDWVHEPIDSQQKLTLTDCLKKEIAIRKIGQEAEDEAEQEENDQDELEEENEDGENEDDFAPSDDGNESDNEAGFAESDDDSDGESDDQFWVPASATAATSLEHVSPARPMVARRQSGGSTDSGSEHEVHRKKPPASIDIKLSKHRRLSKVHQLRPGTPELPDSTDFVCGTLDEDRPLEAAYLSCLEQKKREKYIPIPQDIDPSFPTSDPEDLDEEDDEDLDNPEDHIWLKDQLEGFEDESKRGKMSKHARKRSTLRSPRTAHSPPPKRGVHRSPPPPRLSHRRCSPTPKGRLFGQSPKHLHSPAPAMKLTSPPGTRRQSPTNVSGMTHQAYGIGISRLGQRPHMMGTSSLPRTPNPFFHNYHARTQQNDRVAFGDDTPGRERHVRGPVDIVIGLEKKRQKRKEKFWRQHCRKSAKEQAERKTIPGRGAERMRELGLECAERTRGYGLGQQPALVISL